MKVRMSTMKKRIQTIHFKQKKKDYMVIVLHKSTNFCTNTLCKEWYKYEEGLPQHPIEWTYSMFQSSAIM